MYDSRIEKAHVATYYLPMKVWRERHAAFLNWADDILKADRGDTMHRTLVRMFADCWIVALEPLILGQCEYGHLNYRIEEIYGWHVVTDERVDGKSVVRSGVLPKSYPYLDVNSPACFLKLSKKELDETLINHDAFMYEWYNNKVLLPKYLADVVAKGLLADRKNPAPAS